jgi:TonB family protein
MTFPRHSTIVLIIFACLLGLAPPAVAELTAEERFERISRALGGDQQAQDALMAEAPNDAFPHWVIATTHQQAGRIDKAAEFYQEALRLGDLESALAMSQMYFDARRFNDAHAWGQVWVLHHFDPADIQAGKANQDIGMFMLRRNLDKMDDQQLEQAEQFADTVLNEWLPEKVKERNFCIDTPQVCAGWSIQLQTEPEYPHSMLTSGELGWVRLVLMIDKNGQVETTRHLGSSNNAFRRAAQRTVRRWRFSPPEDATDGTIFVQTIHFVM